MKKITLFIFCVALAFIAGAALSSCNKDDVIGVVPDPEIILDSETGIYTVVAGRELTISPSYRYTENASFKWTLDGRILALTPEFSYVWNEAGEFFITVTVTTAAGSASEEIAINVVEPAVPAISFPIAGDRLVLAVGSEYIFAPEISNRNEDDFAMCWSVNGDDAGNSETFLFSATATGTYTVTAMAQNTYGTASKSIRVEVVETLPYKLAFPSPSYFCKSTTRYTFAGRPVYLTPAADNLDIETILWSVDGVPAECTGTTFVFTPESPGEYLVNASVNDGTATAGVKVVCVDASETDRYRAPTPSSSPYAVKVFEWVPAPGQFIGETVVGGMTGNETTIEAANAWAEKRLENSYYVSLGGFGGYIIVGFDHSIAKKEGRFDFAITGNAFLNAQTGAGGSNEPGIVYVMQDVNGNGLPDDEWHELRGSETGQSGTRQNYAVTYFRPAAPQMNVQWTDNYGVSGCIDYLSAFHRQDYYYPAWIEESSYTLKGTCLTPRTTQSSATGFWDNSAFGWGYADNLGSDNLGSEDAVTGDGQKNGFLIENAMYSDLSHINLGYIDFIMVQTGVNSKAGWLGEVSTEVFGFEDLNISR